jgi:hypothetical protein
LNVALVEMSDCSGCVYRALKKVDPEMGISAKGMAIVNSLVHDVLARLAAVPLTNPERQRVVGINNSLSGAVWVVS